MVLALQAVQRRHSTVEEALSVATQANAKHVLLTHFSQRCPRIPCQPAKTSLIAFDGMRLCLSSLSRLEAVWSAVQQTLQDETCQSSNRHSEQKQTAAPVSMTADQAESPRIRKFPQHIRFED